MPDIITDNYGLILPEPGSQGWEQKLNQTGIDIDAEIKRRENENRGLLVHNMTADADYTLDTVSEEHKNALIKITDTGVLLTAARNIIVPTETRIYVVHNATAQGLTIKTAAGSGVIVTTNRRTAVYCDGTDVLPLIDYVPGTGLTIGSTVFGSGSIEVNLNGTGNRNAFVDLHGDDTYTDFGLRLLRNNAGPNATSSLNHRGTGPLNIYAQDAGSVALGTGGVTRMLVDAAGRVGIGATPHASWSTQFNVLEVSDGNTIWGNPANPNMVMSSGVYYTGAAWKYRYNLAAAFYQQYNGGHVFGVAPAGTADSAVTWNSALSIDVNGNLKSYSTSTAGLHYFQKDTTSDAGAQILGVRGYAAIASQHWECVTIGTASANAANAATKVGKDGVTGRSINAAGTINASGADYAEYETKRTDCGSIAKGSIVGFDASGLLTDVFADAVTFGIKSTDPSYVGGDVWGNDAALGMTRPEQPDYQAPAYTGPPPPTAPTEPLLVLPPQPVQQPDETAASYAVRLVDWEDAVAKLQTAYDAAMVEYQAALVQYQPDLAVYDAAQAAHAQAVADAEDAHAAAMTQYEVDRAAFETTLESERQKVDRVAYSGKVPVNLATGVTAMPGDWIVPVESATGGIEASVVTDAVITFEQYRRAVGQVRSIATTGRPVVAVKVA